MEEMILTEDERELIKCYRELTPADQQLTWKLFKRMIYGASVTMDSPQYGVGVNFGHVKISAGVVHVKKDDSDDSPF